MFERLKVLYKASKLDEAALDRAIIKGWITSEEKALIMGVGE